MPMSGTPMQAPGPHGGISQAAAIAKAGIDSTRLGTGEARKIAEALLAKTRADPRKTDWGPPRGNRPGGGGVEVPRDSDGNITKWVEGMRTCRCGIDGGKHLFKECPVGGKPPSEQKANMVPHETAAPPPATTKSDDAVTPAAISEQLADLAPPSPPTRVRTTALPPASSAATGLSCSSWSSPPPALCCSGRSSCRPPPPCLASKGG